MITELSRVSGALRRKGRGTQERPRPNRRPLCVEALEDRLVLDGGTGLQSSVGTLRQLDSVFTFDPGSWLG